MSKSIPFYPMYPSDWIEDDSITMMTLEEEGALVRLHNQFWIRGGKVKADNTLISRLLRCTKNKAKKIIDKLTSIGKLVIDNDYLFFPEISGKLEIFHDKSKKAKENISKRWEKGNEINGEPIPPYYYSDSDSDTKDKDKDKDKYKDKDISKFRGENEEWVSRQRIKMPISKVIERLIDIAGDESDFDLEFMLFRNHKKFDTTKIFSEGGLFTLFSGWINNKYSIENGSWGKTYA